MYGPINITSFTPKKETIKKDKWWKKGLEIILSIIIKLFNKKIKNWLFGKK